MKGKIILRYSGNGPEADSTFTGVPDEAERLATLLEKQGALIIKNDVSIMRSPVK